MSETTGRMSSSELGELALDAAIQVEDVIHGRAMRLSSVKELMEALIKSLQHATTAQAPLDLALLPIYESAFDIIGSKPDKVGDFRRDVHSILTKFVEADPSKGSEFLIRLRDFCVAIHDQSLSQRIDLLRASTYHDGMAIRAY
jgi:phage-related minor tail protein